MKSRLNKNKKNDYILSDVPSGWCIGSTDHEYVSNHRGEQIVYKLSKQNCDEIFGIVDVEKLADERFDKSKPELEYLNWAFKVGFNKAMELNKDRLFTVEDVRKAYMDGVSNGHNFGYPAIDHTDKYIQSLQQPTEIEVEITFEPCFYDDSLGGFSTSYTKDKPKEQPKLDSNGCLILRKI